MTRIDKLISTLKNSDLSLQEGCEKLGFDSKSLTSKDLKKLHDTIFICAECGWWYPISEKSDFPFANTCTYCEDEIAEQEEEYSER